MLPRQSLKLALAAGLAGLAWGYLTNRREQRVRAFAVLQGVDWFLAAGGASVVTDLVRRALDDDDPNEVTERFTRVDQAVVDLRPER